MELQFQGEVERIKSCGFQLRGSAILAELLPEQELKTKGGLIIATDSDQRKGNSVNAHKLEIAVVLDTGPGDYDPDTRSYDPLDIKPGNVLILNQYAHQPVSKLPGITIPLSNKLVLVPPTGVLAIYPDMAAYQKALG